MSKYGPTVLNIKVNGATTKLTAMESLFMQMAMSMKASGKMIKPMVWDIICMLMELLTMESGKMTSSMEMERKRGLMARDMKALIMKAKNMEGGHFVLQMALYTLVTSNSTRFLGRVSTSGLMVSSTRVNGRRTRCMGTEY